MSDFNPESPVYLDAELTPNQSLSRSAFYVVMAIVVGINVMSAISFLAVGAFPIVGFLGLDILAVWLAFKMCFRQQKQKTRVRITADVLRVDHVNPKGERSNVQLPTAFARIELDEPVKPMAPVLAFAFFEPTEAP